MKKRILNILKISTILAMIGYLMDGDVKEPNMLMRLAEFFGMVGILFTLLSSLYFAFTLLHKSKKRLRA